MASIALIEFSNSAVLAVFTLGPTVPAGLALCPDPSVGFAPPNGLPVLGSYPNAVILLTNSGFPKLTVPGP